MTSEQKGDDKVSKQFMTAEEVADILGYSVGQAYKIIRELNTELKGYIIRNGRIPRKYFYERVGLKQEGTN